MCHNFPKVLVANISCWSILITIETFSPPFHEILILIMDADLIMGPLPPSFQLLAWEQSRNNSRQNMQLLREAFFLCRGNQARIHSWEGVPFVLAEGKHCL